MSLLDEVTAGYGRTHLECFSHTQHGCKCRVRVYGRYLTTKTGKPRIFNSEAAGQSAADAEVRSLAGQAAKSRAAILGH